MLTHFKTERKKFVFLEKDNGDIPIGQLLDAVIDPKNGKIAAWWIQSLEGLRVTIPSDIRAWDKQKIVIESHHDLHKPAKLVRLHKVLDQEVPVIKAKIFEDDQLIGAVTNFSFDTLSPQILTLHVRPNKWFGIGKKQLIPAKKIQKITKDGIYVSTLTPIVKEKSPEDLNPIIDPE